MWIKFDTFSYSVCMKLKLYLTENRITIAEFARRIKYNKSYVTQVALGQMRPGRKLAEAISEGTDGKVTVDDLLSIDPNQKNK